MPRSHYFHENFQGFQERSKNVLQKHEWLYGKCLFWYFFFRSKVEALFEFICQKKYKNKNQKRAKTLGFYFFVECIERIDTQHFCIDTY